jgi:hypothetical protein
VAFDAQWEDYQRMALRFAQSLDDVSPTEASRAFAGFGRQYAQERDSLPQTDADRAFHLMAEATNLIDYHLPFATDEEAETIISRGHRLLEEAISLDPLCHDAVRMDAAARCPSFESYYDFLVSNEPEVRAHCIEAHEKARLDASEERAEMLAHLALWPYLRWQAMIASKALICGRNREAIRICLDLFDLDPTDSADARFTAALAYAKLEDEQGLDQFELRCRRLRRPHTPPDGWLLLARLSLAFRRRDLPRARQLISRLIELYPHALTILAQQRELPDGVFARLAVPPFSEDELVLAVSEATVLTQEGRDSLGHGTLGTWLLEECLSLASREELDQLRDLVEELGRLPGDPLGGKR